MDLEITKDLIDQSHCLQLCNYLEERYMQLVHSLTLSSENQNNFLNGFNNDSLQENTIIQLKETYNQAIKYSKDIDI